MKLGPTLPTGLEGSSMVELGENLFLIGGFGPSSGCFDVSGYQTEIQKLTCVSGSCSWTTLTQQLKVARQQLVAIPVDNDFCL